jgi:hypothetical protein
MTFLRYFLDLDERLENLGTKARELDSYTRISELKWLGHAPIN